MPRDPGYLTCMMKPILRIRRIELAPRAEGDGGAAGSGPLVPRRMSAVDKAAFVLLAIGMIALGGVLLAAGVAVLVALGAGGLVIGTIALAGSRLLGRPGARSRQGEVRGSGAVLPPPPDTRPSAELPWRASPRGD